MTFWTINNGFHRGVYANLDDIFKKLGITSHSNKESADEFLNSKDITNRVFVDGSCLGNGKDDALAGFGVWFGNNDSRNMSKKINGKSTNNTAELTAIVEALKIMEHDKKWILYSDSKYCINCIEWSKKWRVNDWKTSAGKDVKNKELIKEMIGHIAKFDNLQIIHVVSHTNNNDPISIGNAEADKLAVSGASS